MRTLFASKLPTKHSHSKSQKFVKVLAILTQDNIISRPDSPKKIKNAVKNPTKLDKKQYN